MENKMNTAVILAARREKETEIPYPLKSYVDSECLIDRTLRILREVGYTRILLVVGYRAELFDKYKADDVAIIVNENYEFTSSMASLALVKDFVDGDFLLLEGDTFYEKKLVEQLSSSAYPVCLAMTEETGSGDECYVETKYDFVAKITKDRHRVCNVEGELIGVMKLSMEVFERMLQLYVRSTNPYVNYEYLLMDVTDTIERPVIRFRNLIWGDVDTLADFKKLKNVTYRTLCRKEDPFDQENLLSHLSHIFPNVDVGSAEIIQIGGMSNKNFKVLFNGCEYVLRVPGNGSEGMVDRSNEEFNAIEGCKMGVSPTIRYFNPQTGVKLADFIVNAETLNAATIQRHDNMRKVAEIYRKLHNSQIRLKNEFNIFHEIEKYDILLQRANAVMYTGWEDVREKVMALEGYLNEMGVNLCACHNDAVPENFIKAEDGTLYLIDWEYSGVNDPMADFAALFLESEFSEENQDFVLKHYYQGDIPPNTYEKIKCYMILWDYLWSQWTVIKEACGDDFGTYGIDRFNRAKANLELIEADTKNEKTL